MCDQILRIELAKMFTNFVINILSRQPDESRKCGFIDMTNANQEQRLYAQTACQLGIMGLEYDGSPSTVFNPNSYVTRAEFATAFSRVLFGGENNGNASCRYCDHMFALKKADIITNMSPDLLELRAFIMF